MKKNSDKIKAVIFDWGGVCCREGEPFASLALQKKLGMSPEEISAKAKFYLDYYTGKYNYETFWRKIMDFFSLRETKEINPEELTKAYLNSYAVYPLVMRTAKQLKSKYRVSLLSNLTPEMRDWIIKKHGISELFSPMIFSCDNDVRSVKPGSKPYRLILKKLKLRSEQCLFIDNSLKNIQAAEKLGFKTIFFKNPKQFLKEIKAFTK